MISQNKKIQTDDEYIRKGHRNNKLSTINSSTKEKDYTKEDMLKISRPGNFNTFDNPDIDQLYTEEIMQIISKNDNERTTHKYDTLDNRTMKKIETIAAKNKYSKPVKKKESVLNKETHKKYRNQNIKKPIKHMKEDSIEDGDLNQVVSKSMAMTSFTANTGNKIDLNKGITSMPKNLSTDFIKVNTVPIVIIIVSVTFLCFVYFYVFVRLVRQNNIKQ